ncbi:MAG: NAD(P)H-dependent glycerol-3-phosphate dehydrogenase [Phycisphaerales bacterium]
MPPPLPITILGDGQMGLFCASLLANQPPGQNGAVGVGSVTLWGHESKPILALAQTRVSPRLEMVRLPESVRVTDDDAAALRNAGLIVAAVPTQYIRSVLERVRRHIPPNAPIVSVSKGFENGTLQRPTQVIVDALASTARPAPPVGVLSGPTIAPELGRCLPATMLAASTDAALAERVQTLFTTSWLRVYTSDDPVGVEVAGAVKNVIAIAAGIIDGLQAGYNAKSALLARGLAEIARLGAALGAKPETFFGIAGVGDLATTCFSPEGRNRSCGEALGRGEKLSDYLDRTNSVVEGVATTLSVVELAKQFGVEMPITQAVHAVLYEGLDPIDAISRLMTRRVGAEKVG